MTDEFIPKSKLKKNESLRVKEQKLPLNAQDLPLHSAILKADYQII